MLPDEQRQDLSQGDWLRIQEIGDLLYDSSQFSSKIQQAISKILAEFGYSHAALLLDSQPDSGNNGATWLQVNIPMHLQNQFDDTFSQINIIAHDILLGGSIYPSIPYLDLAAAFPISFDCKVYGALFVFGPEIEKYQIDRWQSYLHPIARAVAGWVKIGLQQKIEEQIFILERILTVKQDGSKDIGLIQRLAMESLREFYHAEDVIMVLYNSENPNLVQQKQLGKGQEWIERRAVISEDSDIYQLQAGPGCFNEDICNSNELFSWVLKTADLIVNDTICSPIRTEDCVLGAFLVINPDLTYHNPLSRRFHRLIAAITANTMVASQEINGLRLSIADLEASRWEIQNSRNTLRTFFDSIPASVYIIDKYYTLISINSRRSKRVDKRPNMIVGRKCYEQLYNRSDPCPTCRASEVFNTGQVVIREKREWLNQDSYIDWEIMAFPIQEVNNLPHQVIIFEQDVTEKRNLEADLIQSEKLAAVGQLAAGVAHEINNPLAAIIANVQLLRRELPREDEDVQASLKLIETASIRASQVISNLLGIARKEKKYEFDLVSLNDTIRSAVALVSHEVKNKSIQIQLDLDEPLPEIMASKNHLQGVWINLIVNGMDAIDHLNGKIHIASQYLNSEFRIIIEDNGRGIPEDHLGKIFEPFFTTKNIGRGTGLGLSVSLRVIKEHKGTIQVESQPGKGTRFLVVLPDLNNQMKD